MLWPKRRLRSRRCRLARAGKKSPSGEWRHGPYRKPTQVGRDECPEVDERTLAKELGKLTP